MKYIGVYSMGNGRFSAVVAGRKSEYNILTQQEAAELYDRMALYYLGSSAALNYPDKINQYRTNPYNPQFLIEKEGKRKLTGVTQTKRNSKPWLARVQSVDGKRIVVGYYATIEDAVEARNQYLRDNPEFQKNNKFNKE